MSRRGRGRGRGGLMNKAFLEQLDILKDDLVKDSDICPAETYPSLPFYAAKSPVERCEKQRYMLMVKKELCFHFHNSEYYITLDSKKPDVERYLNKFNCLNTENDKSRLHLDQSRYPKELWMVEKPTATKRNRDLEKVKPKVNIKAARTIKEKDVAINKKLKELEIKETEEGDKENNDENENIVEEEDVDEEMDEGTDYINSYFDNGETYDDDNGDVEEEVF